MLFICDNAIPHEKRWGDRAFTGYAFGAADYFIVQSAAVERDLLKIWPDATYRKTPHPIYNIFGSAISKEDARTQLGISSPRVVLFFGYIRRYKGLHVLLDAMNILKSSRDIHLLAVGEAYEEEKSYRARIDALQLQERVTLHTDYVANDRVRLYFSAADVVILPYLSATQSGITQIAYNFDKPVIATRVGGLAEVVLDGQTGRLVPPGDPGALAQAIGQFYDNNDEERFVANVRREKKKYTWEAMARTIEELAEP